MHENAWFLMLKGDNVTDQMCKKSEKDEF